MTVALCGSRDHDGPCRWPHNSSRRHGDAGMTLRTVFVAPPADEAEVRERIERGLSDAPGWTVIRSGPAGLEAAERELADRLATTPRP